jgi:hypothetical protein
VTRLKHMFPSYRRGVTAKAVSCCRRLTATHGESARPEAG